MQSYETDIEAIKALIARQFTSLNWTPGTAADWEAFAADFSADATLYPSARPAKVQSVDAFIERMKGLAGTKLQTFEERVLGTEVRIFGNVAVAIAGCEILENGKDANRSVEMLLLIRDQDQWRIVSQAWDSESASRPIPQDLLGGS